MKPKELKELQHKSKRLDRFGIRVFAPQRRGEPYTVIIGSSSNMELNRIVTVRFRGKRVISARCTCKWAEFGGIACSHVIAALTKLAERKQRTLSFWGSAEEARRQKHPLYQLVGASPEEHVWITSRRPDDATQEMTPPVPQFAP